MASLSRFRMPIVIGAAALVAAVVVLLAWITPEGHKLSSLDQQKQLLTDQQQVLQATIVTLQHDQDQKLTNCTTLDTLVQEVPASLDESQFVLDVGALATASGASTPAITWGAAASGSGLDSIGVTVAVAGTFGQVMSFVQGLDGSAFHRLFTVSSFSVGAPSSSGNAAQSSSSGNPVVIGNSLQSAGVGNYQVSLGGDIYYATSTPATACTTTPAHGSSSS